MHANYPSSSFLKICGRVYLKTIINLIAQYNYVHQTIALAWGNNILTTPKQLARQSRAVTISLKILRAPSFCFWTGSSGTDTLPTFVTKYEIWNENLYFNYCQKSADIFNIGELILLIPPPPPIFTHISFHLLSVTLKRIAPIFQRPKVVEWQRFMVQCWDVHIFGLGHFF